MSIFGIRDSGTKIVTSGLVTNLDAAQLRSYPRTGTVWSDLSGNNSSGSLLNGASFDSGVGGSIVFDGTDDRVQLRDTGFNNFTSGFTADAWITLAVTNANVLRVFEFGNGIRTNNIAAYFAGTNFAGGFLQYPDGVNVTVNFGATTSWVVNTWYHYAFVMTGTRARVYRNGSQLSDEAFAYLPTNTTRTLNFVGTTSGAFRESWQGKIAEFRVYNRALSATEIAQNYNATKARYGF